MEWTNWSGWVRSQPQKFSKPKSESEIVAAVREGVGPVRVVGSGHSFTALGQTNGTLISLDDFQGVVAADANTLTATVRAGSKIHSLGRPLFDAGVGLKNQGDIDRQAIAGAVGTGTHGTGPTLGSLSAEVRAFRLVTADGQVLDCSQSSNSDVWEAGRVSFGSLGVMSELTLNVKKAYKLREKNWVMPASECWRDLAKQRDAHRHFEFFWFPYSNDVVAKSLDETSETVAEPVSSEDMAARGEKVTADQRTFKYGCEVARFLPSLSARMQQMFTKASMGASSRARWSHEIFPSPRNIRFNEMEYSVPAANGADCVREIAEVIRARKIAGVYPLEFRFVKADDIWLSPFYKRDAVTISVHQYHKQSYDELFGAAEAIFKRYGGRPHWGKLHTLKAAELSRLYPRFDDYCALRKRLDPQGKFLNAHLAGIFGEADGQAA
ncbi:MAG: FAD-binding protein [Alphaproteobacteria bacterium]|nr:FAD-binding protein [Alphaproteobacteria bacterium]